MAGTWSTIRKRAKRMPDIIVETTYGLWFLFIWSSGFGCAFHFMNCTKPLSQNMFVLDLAAGLSFPQTAQSDIKEDGCTISPHPLPHGRSNQHGIPGSSSSPMFRKYLLHYQPDTIFQK